MTPGLETKMTDPVTPGMIRKLWAGESALLRDHLLRLDMESRRFRFGSAVSDEFIDRYASRAFRNGAIIQGYFVDGVLRAAAELYPLGDVLPGEAEAAFSVEHEYQNHGLGTLLVEQVILVARNRGVRSLCMNCLVHNRRMQQIARKYDADLSFDTDEVVAQLKAPFPTAMSLARETATDLQSMAGLALQAQRVATMRLFKLLLPANSDNAAPAKRASNG